MILLLLFCRIQLKLNACKNICTFDAQQDYFNHELITMSNQIELRHLRYFQAVAEDLHYRKAAERLYISQPGLSRQIRQMEEELGVKLFERNNRNVKLTTAGEYFYKESNQMLKNLETVFGHTKLLEQGVEGDLHIGYIGSSMQNIIPELLIAIKNESPTIRFSLEEINSQDQIDALLSHEIDIGFGRLERVPRPLQTKTVLDDTFSLVLPKDHPISEDNFESLKQFKEDPFILFEPRYSQTYYEKVMQLFDDHNFSPITTHNTINAMSIYRLVENNFGVSIVPTSLKLGYDMNIKFIELKNIPQRTSLQVIWNTKNSNPVLENILNLIDRIFEC